VPTEVRRIDLDGLHAFRAAFFTNTSCPVMPIASIDATSFVTDAELHALLDACVATQPWQPI